MSRTVPPAGPIDPLRAFQNQIDPAAWARDVLGWTPDPWQVDFLRSIAKQQALCCSRQSGKSTSAAVKGLHAAHYNPESLILMIAPTQRQSAELLAKASGFLRRVPGAELDRESSVTIKFSHGARLVSLPGTDPDRIRGFSNPKLIIIDEAAFVSDQLYYAIRPMLAVSQGSLIAMSTPNGRQGWFFEEYENTDEAEWKRFRITAQQCPRIMPEFLEKERKRLGDQWFRQEYECQFVSAEDALFDSSDIENAIVPDIPLLPIMVGL